MSRCTIHDLDVECGPNSFRIPELLSNGTALPKTGVLAFYRVVSADTKNGNNCLVNLMMNRIWKGF